MKFQLCSLNSGSCGNSTYISAGGTRLLVDAGLSGRAITTALAQINVLPETLNGLLVTHEHIDHVRGVGVLARKYRLPVYANYRTWQAMHRLVGDIPAAQQRIFDTEQDFFIGDLNILPFAIPHDTVEPVAFRVHYGHRSVAVATDLGHVSKRVLTRLSGTDLVLLESNHDPDMLINNDRYPLHLKRRIQSTQGHLSNAECAQALIKLNDSGVRYALLGHLSQDNNTPELAMQTVCEALIKSGLTPGRDIMLDMTWRDRVGGMYTIE